MRGNKVRKQIFVISGIVLAVAVGALLWYVKTQRNLETVVSTQGRAAVLLVLENGSESVDGFCLMSFSEQDLVLFSLPANLRVRSGEGTFSTLERVYLDRGGEDAAWAAGDVLGLEVPFFVAAERTVLREWMEALGTVAVTVPSDVEYVDALSDPPLRVEVRAGMQQLAPAAALSFAISPYDSDIGELYERQQATLLALLAQGIRAESPRSLRSVVRDASNLVSTNLSLPDLSQVAQVLRAIPASALQREGLIGSEVEIDGVVYTQPSIVQTERLVATLLHGLALLTPGDVRVAVLNGNGVRMMARKTADYLLARGFQIVNIANADSFDYESSYVVVLTDEAKAWILRDALPSAVRTVFPEDFEAHYTQLQQNVLPGTDLLLIAGAGLEIE